MNKEVPQYLECSIECQQIKSEHQHPTLLQPLPILVWKCEVISMDFIIGLPKINIKQHVSIMVIVDNLSKVTQFIRVKSTYKVVNIFDILMKEIFILHDVPKVVI